LERRLESKQVRKRSQARMLALQALCTFEAVGEQFDERLDHFLSDEQVLDDLDIELPPSDTLLSFARDLARGAWAQRKLLDEKLSQTAAHWSLSRMTPVDRNVLRLGLHELLEHPDTPPQVVINEAIELARLFGDADSPAFVNGVLDAIRRAIGETTGDTKHTRANSDAPSQTKDADGAV
jgi:N utilization substance protein B